MGLIVPFPKDAISTRRGEALELDSIIDAQGGAEILFFTGVRYERAVDHSEPSDGEQQDDVVEAIEELDLA